MVADPAAELLRALTALSALLEDLDSKLAALIAERDELHAALDSERRESLEAESEVRRLRSKLFAVAGQCTDGVPLSSCVYCGMADDLDEEAQSQARQRFRSAQRQAVKMSLTVVGDPQLRADNTIRIEGVGQKYSGNYYVEEVTHDEGFMRCQVTLARIPNEEDER